MSDRPHNILDDNQMPKDIFEVERKILNRPDVGTFAANYPRKATMKLALSILLLSTVFAVCVFAKNDVTWGKISKKDQLLAKDKVKKLATVGLITTKKYVFRQRNVANALTITGIRVTDNMKKNGPTAELLYGGPGSKGATILFRSKRGHKISATVEIFGQEEIDEDRKQITNV